MNVRRERCSYVGLGLVVGLAIAGCGKLAPESTPPVAAADEGSSAGAETRPGEVVNEYEGREDDEDDGDENGDEADDDDDADDDASEATAADDGKLDAEELHALANAALDQVLEPGSPRMVTPLLPSEWPPTSGTVMVLAYPLTPIEGELTHHTLMTASHRVTIAVGDGTVTTEPLGKKSKKLGTIDKTRERSDDPIHAAEQALVDVVAGRRAPEKSRMLLMPYTTWAEGHGLLGKDVSGRQKPFFEGLQK